MKENEAGELPFKWNATKFSMEELDMQLTFVSDAPHCVLAIGTLAGQAAPKSATKVSLSTSHRGHRGSCSLYA
jgi:hypothetical protein